MANQMYYLRSLSKDGRIDAETALTLKVSAAGKKLNTHVSNNPCEDLIAAILVLKGLGWSASKALIILRNRQGQNAKIELNRAP